MRVLIECRTLRVWVKRDDGTYWPTICQTYQGNVTARFLYTNYRYPQPFAAATSSIAYNHRNHKLFVGLSTGLILVSVRVYVCVFRYYLWRVVLCMCESVLAQGSRCIA